MKTLLLLTLVSLVLNVGLALPFSDNDLDVQNNNPRDIKEDLVEENPERYFLYEITLERNKLMWEQISKW